LINRDLKIREIYDLFMQYKKTAFPYLNIDDIEKCYNAGRVCCIEHVDYGDVVIGAATWMQCESCSPKDNHSKGDIYIKELAVSKRFRNKGFGYILMVDIERVAVKYCANAIILNASSDNIPVNVLCHNCGYLIVGSFDVPCKDSDKRMFVYRKDL